MPSTRRQGRRASTSSNKSSGGREVESVTKVTPASTEKKPRKGRSATVEASPAKSKASETKKRSSSTASAKSKASSASAKSSEAKKKNAAKNSETPKRAASARAKSAAKSPATDKKLATKSPTPEKKKPASKRVAKKQSASSSASASASSAAATATKSPAKDRKPAAKRQAEKPAATKKATKAAKQPKEAKTKTPKATREATRPAAQAAIGRARAGAGAGNAAAAAEAAPPQDAGQYVYLKCIRVGPKLRVRITTPGYNVQANCQFPRAIRVEGRIFRVPAQLVHVGAGAAGKFFYRIPAASVQIVHGDEAERVLAEVQHQPKKAAEKATKPQQIFTIAECTVCLDNESDMVFVPCGHMCICRSCCSQLQDSRCIMCRTVSTHKIHKSDMD